MKDKIKQLFPKEEQQERVIAFLSFFQQRQHEINRSYKKVEYVYLHSDFLRTLLGRTSYLGVLDVLCENGIIHRTNFTWRTRYKRILNTFEPLKLDSGTIESTPKRKRVQNAVSKANELKKTINIKTIEAALVVDQFDVTDENGVALKGNWHESNFSGRIFNPATSTKRDERHNLRIDGESLVELDVKACQPTLLRQMMVEEGVGTDFVKHFDSCDDIYKTFWFSSQEYDRQKAKGIFYECIFGTAESTYHKMFCTKFPMAGKWLTEFKLVKDPKNPSDKVYSNVCRELQLREVAMFTPIWMELYNKGIKFAPIHDAVAVKVSDFDKAIKIVSGIVESCLKGAVVNCKEYKKQ